MHEISIALNIIEIAEAKAREGNSRCIQTIKIRLGEFTTVVPRGFGVCVRSGSPRHAGRKRETGN